MLKLNEVLLEKYCNIIIESKKSMTVLKTVKKIGSNDVAIRSQFAGSPYWPSSREAFWEKLVTTYKEFSLLVQLDLKEIKDSRLPTSGLIQIFVIGRDYKIYEEEPTENEDVRGVSKSHFVVYHSNDSLDDNMIVECLLLDKDESNALEFSATPSISIVNMTNTQYIDAVFSKHNISEKEIDVFNDYDDVKNLEKILQMVKSDSLKSILEKTIELKKKDKITSRVDGYPHFSQDDERSENTKMTELLVQLSSDDNMMFGDMGDIQIFTSSEDLLNIDENKIMNSYLVFQCY